MTAQAQTTASARQETGKSLVGTWKLKSCFMEDIETKEQTAPWGKRPNGYLMLTAAGHWIVVQTAEGRKAPQNDEDQCAAFRSMLAYSGRYRIDGQKVLINVEIAWDESWTGTEQVRFFKLDGNRLHIEAAPQRYANFGDKLVRAVLVWERVG